MFSRNNLVRDQVRRLAEAAVFSTCCSCVPLLQVRLKCKMMHATHTRTYMRTHTRTRLVPFRLTESRTLCRLTRLTVCEACRTENVSEPEFQGVTQASEDINADLKKDYPYNIAAQQSIYDSIYKDTTSIQSYATIQQAVDNMNRGFCMFMLWYPDIPCFRGQFFSA